VRTTPCRKTTRHHRGAQNEVRMRTATRLPRSYWALGCSPVIGPGGCVLGQWVHGYCRELGGPRPRVFCARPLGAALSSAASLGTRTVIL
jgi:hypothetical protein